MREINEPQTILPVQPSNPGRRPGPRRQAPRREDPEHADKRKPEPGADDGRVVDEYA